MSIILILSLVFLVWSALISWIFWGGESLQNMDKIVFIDFKSKPNNRKRSGK